jgi:hypothetical protein
MTGFENKPMHGVVSVAVLALAGLSLMLHINYFFSIGRMYKNIRLKYIEKEHELMRQTPNYRLSFQIIQKKN